MASIEVTKRPTTILWQDVEQAVAFFRYNDCLEIRQGENEVIISDDNFKEFLKAANIAFKIGDES